MDGAEYDVWLDAAQTSRLAERLPEHLAARELLVERVDRKALKRRRRRDRDLPPPLVTTDLRPMIADARLERADDGTGRLVFRLRSESSQASARPREIVAVLVGEGVPDVRLTRRSLLSRGDDGHLVPLHERGPVFRDLSRMRGDQGAMRAAAMYGVAVVPEQAPLS